MKRKTIAMLMVASMTEALDGKSAEDVMADVQKAAKEVADANK